MLNRATRNKSRNAPHVLPKSQYQANATESGPTAVKRTTENRVSLYRILARAKGGGRGGLLLNMHEAAWMARALFGPRHVAPL